MRTRTIVGVLIIAIPLLLVGCSQPEDPAPLKPKSFVGMSVAQLEQALPPDTAYVAYDLSLPVTGSGLRYGTSSSGTNRDWIVVVACGSREDLAVGLLNVDAYDTEFAASAKAGKFNSLLSEC